MEKGLIENDRQKELRIQAKGRGGCFIPWRYYIQMSVSASIHCSIPALLHARDGYETNTQFSTSTDDKMDGLEKSFSSQEMLLLWKNLSENIEGAKGAVRFTEELSSEGFSMVYSPEGPHILQVLSGASSTNSS